MKKLILLLAFITACQTAESEVDCSPDYTYPISMQELWETNGKTYQYDLPWCWSAMDNVSNLQLEDPESEAFVRFSLSSEEQEEMGLSQKEITLTNGELIYAIFPTEFYEDGDVQILLNSFKLLE